MPVTVALLGDGRMQRHMVALRDRQSSPIDLAFDFHWGFCCDPLVWHCETS
jgi:hypothetical protein